MILLCSHALHALHHSHHSHHSLHPHHPHLWMPALFALAIGCSSNGDVSNSSDADVQGDGAGGSGDSSLVCNDTSEELDLDGYYALHIRLSFTFASQPGGAVTVCPIGQTNEGSFLGFAKIAHQPGQTTASISAVACSLELPVVSAIVGTCKPTAPNVIRAGLVFPQALLDAAPTVDTAEATMFLSSPFAGATVTADSMRFSLGSTEPMATAPKWLSDQPGCGMTDNASGRSPFCEDKCVSDCSKMTDDDEDGWPGVTVHVCGRTDEDTQKAVPCNAERPNEAGTTIQGRSFMNLQVEPLTISGQFKSSCEAEGNLDADFFYNVVGADLYLANTQISVSSAIKSLPIYSINSAESRYRLVRIDGKYGGLNWDPSWSELLASCRRIIAGQHELR